MLCLLTLLTTLSGYNQMDIGNIMLSFYTATKQGTAQLAILDPYSSWARGSYYVNLYPRTHSYGVFYFSWPGNCTEDT